MKSKPLIVAIASFALLSACSKDEQSSSDSSAQADSSDPMAIETSEIKPADNPFFKTWDGPFGAPPFSDIKNEHYLPAFKEAMRIHNEEIERIANQPEAPSFANTIDSFDASGRLLTKISSVFFNLASSYTNDELQKIQAEISPQLAKHTTDIELNAALYERIKTLHNQRGSLNLSDEQDFMLERTRLDFVRAGADLKPAEKARLNEINQEVTKLTVQFSQNLLAENKAFELILETEEELSGLPESLLSAASSTAKERGYEGKYVFTLIRSSMNPFLQYSNRRDLREKISKAWSQRGDNGNEYDNKSITANIAALRVERAHLLGYKTHADWVLEDNMSGTPEKVYQFMDKIWKPAIIKAKEERAALQAMIQEEGHDFKLAPWDWFHFAEKVRKARYEIDDEQVKPYFELNSVRDTAFKVAGRLFGITFHEIDAPVYVKDVQVFEVKDADQQHLAVFYFDFFARTNKRGGAWMSSFRGQSKVTGKNIRPIVINNLNLPKGMDGAPTLLSFSNARTLFHEFGHGLHGLLSNVTYNRTAGISGPRDYTEFPAQLMEHWITDSSVLKENAKHYKTGEAIPDELVQRIKDAAQFGQGFKTIEYLSAAILDMDWHTLETQELQDTLAFEQKTFDRIGLIPEIIVRYRTSYFAHIFSSPLGYSSGYYAYIWSEILDSDAFKAFKESGDIYNSELSKRVYENIYSAGGSDDAMNLYVKFRGKEPDIDGLLEGRGLKEVTP